MVEVVMKCYKVVGWGLSKVKWGLSLSCIYHPCIWYIFTYNGKPIEIYHSCRYKYIPFPWMVWVGWCLPFGRCLPSGRRSTDTEPWMAFRPIGNRRNIRIPNPKYWLISWGVSPLKGSKIFQTFRMCKLVHLKTKNSKFYEKTIQNFPMIWLKPYLLVHPNMVFF